MQNDSIQKFNELLKSGNKTDMFQGLLFSLFILSVINFRYSGPIFEKKDEKSMFEKARVHIKKKQDKYKFCRRCGATAPSLAKGGRPPKDGSKRTSFEEKHRSCVKQCQNCQAIFTNVAVFNHHLQSCNIKCLPNLSGMPNTNKCNWTDKNRKTKNFCISKSYIHQYG